MDDKEIQEEQRENKTEITQAPAESAAEKKGAATPENGCGKCGGKGLSVTTIIFLVLGAVALAVYLATSASFFLTYFDKNNSESAEAAIGAVFALLLSTPLMLLSAPPTLLFLSLATAFSRKVSKARGTTGAKVCFILSDVLLSVAVLVTIAVIVVFILN